ncbi:MAG: glycosyltransferase [Planctomycetes bacterium]|nr:glycosyltransferase [Planctomycetota bacterium]
MPAHDSLTFVLPTINEAGNVGPLIDSLLAELADAEPEFLVIDGNSSDDTVAEAEAVGARVIVDDKGYAAALMLGLNEANTTWVMVMDADGSHKAEDATKLWAAREDADLVVGSRMVKGGGSDGSAFRRGLSRIIAGMFAWFARLPARDISSGFRLYRREMFKDAQPAAKFFEVQPTLLAYAKINSARVKEVGIWYHQRGAGRSKNRVVRYGFAFLASLWKLRSQLKRTQS